MQLFSCSSFSHHSRLGKTTLALLGLGALVAGPATAQSLTLGTSPPSANGPSGSATIGAAGTQVSGTFKFTSGAGPSTTAYRSFILHNASTLTLNSGGSASLAVFNGDTSTFTMNGGSVPGILSTETSVTNIYGGTANNLHQANNSTANIYGGNTPIFETDDQSSLYIFGTNLQETYFGTSDPTITGLVFDGYYLTGTLQDGTVLNSQYAAVAGSRSLFFNGIQAVPAVPEASTTVSLGLLLALGGLAAAFKKKKAEVSA